MAFNYPNKLIFLATRTASTSASLDFNSVISSKFNTYYAKLRAIVPETGNTSLLVLYSVDNGANYLTSNNKWSTFRVTSSTASAVNGSDSDSSITIFEAASSTSTNRLNGEVTFYNINDGVITPKQKSFIVQQDNGSEFRFDPGAAVNTGTTAVNAIQFKMSTDNIISGSIHLYGVVEP